MSDKSAVLIGAGGHATVILDMLREQARHVDAVVSPNPPSNSVMFEGERVLHSDEEILSFDRHAVLLVNGIGFMPGQELRQKIYSRFTDQGYRFETLISPYAVVSPNAMIGAGAQIMAGAIVQAGATVGANTIINTGAIVEHDCHVAEHCHVAPRATLCGGVVCGEAVFIGAGATVIQSQKIGTRAVVAAGSVVTKAVGDGVTAISHQA